MSGRLNPRRVLWGIAVLLLLAVATFAFQAWRAGSALSQVRSQAQTLTGQLNAGDLAGARRTATSLRDDTGRAHGDTDGPLWDIGSHLPLIGRNIGAVQTSAAVLDAIATHSLPTLLDLADEVDHGRLRPRHGRVDLTAVRNLTPSVRAAARGVDGPAAELARIQPQRLVYPLNDLVGELRDRAADARAAIDATADAFDVLPTMLGADGPRTYLLLVQNNAEIRSTGGMPGSWAVLHARNGKLTMGEQGDANLFRSDRQPVALTRQEADLYGSDLGLDPRDITFTPDFPRAAQMAARLAAFHGVHVDGVFAVDPIALGMVLQGTGPVTPVPGVQLNGADAAPLLLNTVYRTVDDPNAQNDFYEAAARKTFNALVAGQGDQVRAIRGLVLAAGQRRVMAWSNLPGVAKVIGDNQLSGALPRDTGSTPQVGLYLNDGVAGKMEYYLRYSSAVTSTGCDDEGVQDLRLTATLRSTAPDDVIGYPVWVTGTGQYVARGDILMNLRLYSPWRGSIRSIRVNGRPVTVTGNLHDGHQVGMVPVQLRPGQAMTVSATMRTGPHQTGDPRVTSTPGMETGRNPQTFPTSCG